jgi:chromosome segregation ATPase
MSPQRLYEFLRDVWIPARILEKQQAESRARTAAATHNLDILENMRSRIGHELTQIKTEVQNTCGVADEANKSLTELNSAIAAINADRAVFHAELTALESPQSALDVKSRLEYRSYLTGKLADAERALAELNEALPTESEQFRRANAALVSVEGKIRDKEAELAETQGRIREVRDMLAHAVDTRARSILGSGAHGSAA